MKKEFKIAHLKITDHLVLGMMADRLQQDPTTYNFGLECQPKVGWNQIGDALQNREVDGAFILAPFAMDLFKSGMDIRLLMCGHKNGSVLVRNHRAGVESIEDFKGKLIVFPYQLSIHTLIFHKLLAQKGLELGPGKDVQIEVMAPMQMVEAMEFDDEGELGGFIVAEPFGSQCIKKGFGQELLLSKDVWPGHPCCVLVMHNDVIEENKAAVEEFCGAMVECGQLIADQPQVGAEVGSRFLSQDADVVYRVLTDPPDRVTTNDLFPVVDDLVEMKEYMSKHLNLLQGELDFDRFLVTDFARTVCSA